MFSRTSPKTQGKAGENGVAHATVPAFPTCGVPMSVMLAQAAPRAGVPRCAVGVRYLSRLIVLPVVAALTGCAAMDPGNWQVFGPPSSYVRPAPVIVAPAPTLVQPAPVIVAPAVVTPAPVIIAPRPHIVPAPVIISPAQPRTSRDAAHFLRERCYLQQGGCYTAESRQGYEYNPYTGRWDWVNQTDYHWKQRRQQRRPHRRR